jgi:hypothetical protein
MHDNRLVVIEGVGVKDKRDRFSKDLEVVVFGDEQ